MSETKIYITPPLPDGFQTDAIRVEFTTMRNDGKSLRFMFRYMRPLVTDWAQGEVETNPTESREVQVKHIEDYVGADYRNFFTDIPENMLKQANLLWARDIKKIVLIELQRK